MNLKLVITDTQNFQNKKIVDMEFTKEERPLLYDKARELYFHFNKEQSYEDFTTKEYHYYIEIQRIRSKYKLVRLFLKNELLYIINLRKQDMHQKFLQQLFT